MQWLVVVTVSILAVGLAQPASLKSDLVFLMRDGCVNTPALVANLNDALTALKLPKDYQFIDIGTLSKDEPRTGYPTPTVLWKGRDIFGMAPPKPPYGMAS